MSRIVLFGTGGGADTAYRYFSRDTSHEIVAFTVDAVHRKSETFRSLPLVDFERVQEIYPPNEYKMFVLLNFRNLSELRIRKYHEAKAKGYTLASYVASNIFRIEDIQVG